MHEPTKVIGRRTLAYVIDAVPAVVLFALATRAFGEEQANFVTPDTGIYASWGFFGPQYVAEGGDALRVFALVLAFVVGNLVVLQGLGGASIGKLVVGLRVVRPDGSTCGLGAAVVRWLVLFVDAFPFIVPLVGFVLCLSSTGNRRLGDMAAGTYVVRAAAAGQAVVVGPAGGTAPPVVYGPPAPDARWDPARNAWIRWDGAAWTAFDPTTGRWYQLT